MYNIEWKCNKCGYYDADGVEGYDARDNETREGHTNFYCPRCGSFITQKQQTEEYKEYLRKKAN
jgi:predicted RNA-binding Zn-ribbon protein involved in translation (DUF1610 family)